MADTKATLREQEAQESRLRVRQTSAQAKGDPLAGLTIGRSIHFCYERPNPEGTTVELVHRAAFVVSVEDRDAGTIELAWLPAQSDGVAPFVRVYGCPYSAEPVKGSWHWIERAD